MILTHLEIGRSWENKPATLGHAKFLGKDGTIQIYLSESLTKAILAACAAEIVNAANDVAESLKAETIADVQLIGKD